MAIVRLLVSVDTTTFHSLHFGTDHDPGRASLQRILQEFSYVLILTALAVSPFNEVLDSLHTHRGKGGTHKLDLQVFVFEVGW